MDSLLVKATDRTLWELSQNCGGHWITFGHRHRINFAAKLGGGELPELMQPKKGPHGR